MRDKMMSQVEEVRRQRGGKRLRPPTSVPSPVTRHPSPARLGGERVRYALLVIHAILCLYPVFCVRTASLRTSAGVCAAGLSLWVDDPQWANYAEIWQEANVPRAAFVTVVITAVCMAVTILTTSMTAFAVTRSDFPGRRLVMVALL